MVVGHGGDAVGGKSQLLIFPDQNLVVAASTNLSRVNLYEFSSKIGKYWKDYPSQERNNE